MQAVGIGKPVIIGDFYGYHYKFYDNIEGVSILTSKDELITTLDRIISNFDNKPSGYKGSYDSEWILFDGKCTERIIYLL